MTVLRQALSNAFKNAGNWVSSPKQTGVTCPYCGSLAKLVTGEVIYPHRPDLFAKKFWQCEPCDAYCGCHAPNPKYGFDGTQPLGTLANKELRRIRLKTHAAFDPMWKDGTFASRRKAYTWLAGKLEMPVEDCHIGSMNALQCQRATVFATEHRRETRCS